ncbi:boophilin-H2 [Ixodes scapularis]|uniref:boophilin-H2 n=1 Tax=Ixodes scapularis TaxID=6945 RepID=UPI001A9E1892|nr:boophilin-H2 [Ixodes scapularis]
MRASVCFVNLEVAWMFVGLYCSAGLVAPSSSDEIKYYEDEPWVFCLDPDNVTCPEDGTHASYNRNTGMCELKNGSDCGGGENHYPTLEKCNSSCNSAPKPPCSLELNEGLGKAYMQRWFFNTSSASCEMFIFGGGPGQNGNNFEDKNECRKTCNGFSLYRRINITVEQ